MSDDDWLPCAVDGCDREAQADMPTEPWDDDGFLCSHHYRYR